MSQIVNPFNRGYQRPRIERTLLITYADDCPPVWRPLHLSQAHLRDDQVALFPCLFGKDFALITEGQDVREELEAQCQIEGIVRTAVYAVTADNIGGQQVHVGDTYSEENAREVVRHLRFETGVYSRCWEISSAHLTEEADRYLTELADYGTPSNFMFVAFRIPYSPVIGVKLIATPWTNENLQKVDGITAEWLRLKQRKKGVPECLIEVLHLAAMADVRMLVFDADAPLLDGLTLYEDE
ncbi:ABC transporter substrate-binding protein [Sodalis sp. RH22]|uniref:DUF5983 family protein n=1 Tax=unclassified Sodalis (in: enterobacteria) TaxID=2636512 RepID=UPI0039B53B26